MKESSLKPKLWLWRFSSADCGDHKVDFHKSVSDARIKIMIEDLKKKTKMYRNMYAFIIFKFNSI
ncbi:hypothetical protein [Gillisia sp. Hel_I_29]|uniref:hypothetical protein n=1 Tax=Gillisia sp. Hel_I_29 TaxID=1249975 RepID=UPI000553B47C|nr:hypothetical protein [Gillisia sp. Hel_I_29]